MDSQALAPIRDADRDCLYVLPLALIPLECPPLKRARLIKNVRLNSVVELFDDSATGSGQIDIEDLQREFGWRKNPPHPDLQVLRKLAALPSFDVYSLRVLLREHGIPVNDFNALRLSETKHAELTEYMASFTRPLIRQIYGKEDVSVENFDGLLAMFRDPDVKRALQKLKIMAARLEIQVNAVPRFLEDYGDIFLSLSYYQEAFDHIAPILKDFIESLEILRHHYQFKNDRTLITTCAGLQEVMTRLMANLGDRFKMFNRDTRDMWSRISAERFRRVQKLITAYHTTLGGMLCALTVKMDTWAKLFPNPEIGGPSRRAEFIMSEMRQGIEKMQQIEKSAPLLSELV